MIISGIDYWMMGPNYQSNTGDIKSLNPGQILLPKNKWEYGFINSLVWSWINLNLTMSKPDFPNNVLIQLHSNSTESLRRFSGSFGKDDQLSHRDLPVWVNKDEQMYLFNSGPKGWLVSNEVGEENESGEQILGVIFIVIFLFTVAVYGWDETNKRNMFVWPNASILHLIGKIVCEFQFSNKILFV